jgi:hypothetical protein
MVVGSKGIDRETGRQTMTGRATCTPSGGSGMQSAAESSVRAEVARSPWTELEHHLENTRRSILAEIRNYPPPIAACDQQFNYLLEQRDRIAGELSRLASIRRDNSTKKTDVKAVIDFITASDCIPHELKEHLIQLLNHRLGEPT